MSNNSGQLTLSRTLKSLVQKVFNQRQIHLVYQKIATRMGQYIVARNVGAESAATSFQQLVDFETEYQKQNSVNLSGRISCRKGCSFCCEQPVEITQDEARLIVGYVSRNSIPISWGKLAEQATWSAKKWRKKKRKDRECVFLSSSGACRIYDFRPMSCRKLISLDDPAKCDLEQSQTPEMFIVPESEIIASAAFNASSSGILPKMLLAAKGEDLPGGQDERNLEPSIIDKLRPDGC